MNENCGCGGGTCSCGCCEGTQSLTPRSIVNRPGLEALRYRVGTHASFLETMKARLGNLFLPPPLGEEAVLLTPTDLTDAAGLADKLVAAKDELSSYIFGQFVPAVQDTLKNSQVAAERQAALLLGFNTLIQAPVLIYNRTAFENVNLSQESRQLLSQFPTGKTPDLNDPTVVATLRRLNRALLQDAFPAGVGRPGVSYPLQALKTRASDDFSMALLDGWATVADVLTFYQERVANEGYLRTALERRSVLELARLIGYKLRPGVSASTYLAYTLEKDQEAFIPVGSKVQSIPGPGEKAQTFETTDPLKAHYTWNNLQPRLSQPQFLTRAALQLANQVYLKGIATNLKPNDALLVDYGVGQPNIFFVESVTPDAPKDRTLVKFQVKETSAFSQAGNISVGRFDQASFATAAAFASTTSATPTFTPQKLGQLVDDLKKPPSIPPPNSLRLNRNPHQLLAAGADIYQQLLPAIRPELEGVLTAASRNAQVTQTTSAKVYALRVKAGVFGNNAPKRAIVPAAGSGNPIRYEEWTFLSPEDNRGLTEDGNVIWLEAPYDQVKPGSWILINRPVTTSDNLQSTIIAKTGTVTTASRGDYGIAGKGTRINLINPTTGTDVNWLSPDFEGGSDFSVLRGTTVYTQSEELPLAEELLNEPPNDEVCGNLLELDDFYAELNTGRWLVVSGERADIPGTGGVKVSELVMLAGVEQGVQQVGRTSGRVVTGQSGSLMRPIKLTKTTKILLDGQEIPPDYRGDLKHPPFLVVQGHRDAGGTLIADVVNVVSKGGNELASDPSSGIEIASGQLIGSDVRQQLFYLEGVVDRPDDKVHTFLRLAQPLAYCYKRSTVKVYGNVVKANHGETRNEVLGNGDATQPFQTFTLKQPPLTFVSANTPSGADSTLKVYVNQVEWHETDTLADLGPNARNFTTKTDNDGKTSVIFGNGLQGARPPTGLENIKAVYRNGIGKSGNVRAEQISLLVSRPLGVKEVINPLPGTGGADPETRDKAKKNAPLAVMALDRLVSVPDYEDFARTFAGIGKARAQKLSDGQRQVILLTIAGDDDIPIAPTSDLYQNLRLALHTFGDPMQPVVIKVRELLPLVISAGVKLEPDYLWEGVEPKIRAKLLDTFSFERRELGQPVQLSEVITVIQNVRGVAYVDVDLLKVLNEETIKQLLDKTTDTTPTSPPSSPPGSPPSSQAATPSAPGSSEVPPVSQGERDKEHPGEFKAAGLVYLVPDVPDTLILRELN